jgi:hypothetical protein
MNYCENESTPQGTRIYREKVTSQYKKYRPPILLGLRGIVDGLVTSTGCSAYFFKSLNFM